MYDNLLKAPTVFSNNPVYYIKAARPIGFVCCAGILDRFHNHVLYEEK